MNQYVITFYAVSGCTHPNDKRTRPVSPRCASLSVVKPNDIKNLDDAQANLAAGMSGKTGLAHTGNPFECHWPVMTCSRKEALVDIVW